MTSPFTAVAGSSPADRIRTHLAGVMRLRAQVAADPALQQATLTLKAWQAARLARTYADLLASARYRGAALFFLEELYGARDFSQRDADVERILPNMTRLLPASALTTIAGAIELDELSEALDSAVASAHGKGAISEASYAAAYRAASIGGASAGATSMSAVPMGGAPMGGAPMGAPSAGAASTHTAALRAARERQIALLDQTGHALDRLTRVPMLFATLKLMRTPARLAGLSGLQQFLERGFAHCRDMHGVDAFLGIIVSRETRAMERLFAGAPDPFAVPPESV